MDFKTYASLKRGMILQAIFQWSHYWADKVTWKCSCLILCRNSIIHIICKQNKIQAAGKTSTASPTATNATSRISNTSLTSTSTLHLIQQHLLWLILIKSLSVLSPPLHHLVFLLLHFLFPITNAELASMYFFCPISCWFPFHIQPTKSLPALRLILWLVCWPIMLWSTANIF